MLHSVQKTCADYLRNNLSQNYNIKLKSGHAHDIVASVFGYKSSIALNQDETHNLANLDKADFIILDPPISIIEQRLASLKNLPSDLPSSHELAQIVYLALKQEQWIAEKIIEIPSLQEQAIDVAKQKVKQDISPMPELEAEIEKQIIESEICFIVTFPYFNTDGEKRRNHEVDVKFLRVAGNIGYKTPKTKHYKFSAQFTDPNYDPDFHPRNLNPNWGE